MPVPFFVFLKKIHTVPKVTSYNTQQSQAARHLQILLAENSHETYYQQLAEYERQGLTFRITNHNVYETKYEGETIDVRVALQVSGCAINWYFWAPDAKDQFPQEFRDRLYNAASECHRAVSNGCDLYYRGSNTYHIKTMHHLKTEADQNHNHYRVVTEKVSVADLEQHLQAFKQHQVHDEFFEAGEIDEICKKFATFYTHWTTKSADGKSPEDRYRENPAHQLNEADLLEFKLFGLCQEPCRIKVSELMLDFNAARKHIEESIVTGDTEKLHQEIATLTKEYVQLLKFRQTGGIRAISGDINLTPQEEMDNGVPNIPSWATSVRNEVTRVKQVIQAKSEQCHIDENKGYQSAARLFSHPVIDSSMLNSDLHIRSARLTPET